MKDAAHDKNPDDGWNSLEDGDESAAVLPFDGSSCASLLVINAGSSTLKWSYFDTANEGVGANGRLSRSHHGNDGKSAFHKLMDDLRDPDTGLAPRLDQLTLIAHRVVHGGTKFVAPVVLSPEVIAELQTLEHLAPLHMPACLEGIHAARAVFPKVPQVAVFDTAFHATMPLHARLYGLPYSYYEKLGIRRFGFHGLSHAYAVHAAAFFLKRAPEHLKVVICHLGGGASVCAVRHGRSVDCTMGFSPTEGLLMGSRCGDIDPSILFHLAREKGYSYERAERLLNEESGLLGLSGISADYREIEAAAAAGHRRAQLALHVFSYRVRKAIGAASAVLGGMDTVVFTGGIGQGSANVRESVLGPLQYLGISLDSAANEGCKADAIARISEAGERLAVLVVPCREDRMIAAEALRVIKQDAPAKVRGTRLSKPIPIETSAHHVHLSDEHLRILFGPDHPLTKSTTLSQPGQYACSQAVTVVGPAGYLEDVRVVGPPREKTQVEISKSDQFKLGLRPPIRESGDLDGSCGCVLVGPAGRVVLERGVICAMRHIHMSPGDASEFGVHNGSVVRVRIGGDREMVYGDVKVRVDPAFRLAMHLDTDEANAGNLGPDAIGYLEGVQETDD